MKKVLLSALAIGSLVLVLGHTASGSQGTFEYPYYLVDAYNPDDDCWKGMNAQGAYQVVVIPEKWLVGPPLSDKSGVTLPPDHWVELKFHGKLVDGPGDDISLIELGPVEEEALIFITDGAGQEYLLGLAKSGSVGQDVDPTQIDFDIAGIVLPFVPCAVRVVSLTLGGQSPGFDIANVRARIDGSCSEIASYPSPIDGAQNVCTDAVLSWLPGCSADKHTVYFGTSVSDVDADATPVSDPLQPQDVNSYDPCDLELSRTYVWRIDEVDLTSPNSPATGNVWSFTVADCLVVDDFESYDNSGNPVSGSWVPYDADVYISSETVQACTQTMVFKYYCYDRYYSDVLRTFTAPQDWASSGTKVLELFFRGQEANVGDVQMYITVSDGTASVIVPYDGDANDLKDETWRPWRIYLRDLTKLDLTHIESICLGVRPTRTEPIEEWYGAVYFDDIRVCTSRCFQENRPKADLTGDCAVGYEDLEEVAYSWLDREYNVYPVAAPNAPAVWYKFDGDTLDYSGNGYHGVSSSGSPTYVPGVYGQAISFDGKDTSLNVTGAAGLFGQISTAITIAFWQYGQDSPHHTDTLCCSDYVYGVKNPAIAIHLGCWRQPGQYRWDCGYPWSFDNRLGGNHRYKGEWAGRWNHWAFTKDAETGVMQIFLNGVLYDSREGANSSISGITSFEIGRGWYGGYDGLIDDFRIYDYALSQPEIAYVATNGTGVFDQALLSPADLYADNQIDFKDFSILADNWLDEQLWP
jgi:hypothetical protein